MTRPSNATAKPKGDDSSEEEFHAFDYLVVLGLILILASVVMCFSCVAYFPIGNNALLYKSTELEDADLEDMKNVETWAGDDDARKDLFLRILYEAKSNIRYGWHLKMQGNIVYVMSVVTAAAVPVLIANIGSFGERVDVQFKVCAIILSLVGSLCMALTNTYKFSERGCLRVDTGMRMLELFNNFYAAVYSLQRSPSMKEAVANRLKEQSETFKRASEASEANLDKLVDKQIEADALQDMVTQYIKLEAKCRGAVSMGASNSHSDHDANHEAYGQKGKGYMASPR